jgi:prepilin-type N-terminal cleavage/methylation domain-containing protein
MSISSHHSRFSGKGFTLIELLVVIAIMTIMTAVILVQHKRFDSSTLLRSLAYKVALSVRQAQIYGTSVRQFNTGASSFSYSYGVYFAKSGLSCSNGTSCYMLFADVNGDKTYNSSPTEEKVQLFNAGNGYSIKTFCARNSTTMVCANACPSTVPVGVTCTASVITKLTIYFKRPNPDAQFQVDIAGTYSGAYVQLEGPTKLSGDTRGITITSTGQISVGEQGS